MDLQGQIQYVYETSARAFDSKDLGRVVKNAAKFHTLLDSSLNQSIEGDEVVCQEGCSYCCHRMVDALPAEILAIAKTILERWSSEEIETLKSKLKDKATLFGPYWKDEAAYPAGQACALLRDGRCSVYENRPATCRGNFSTDLEGCKEFGAGIKSDPFLPEPGNVATDYWASAARGQSAAQQPSGLYELESCLLDLLERSEGLAEWASGIPKWEPYVLRTAFTREEVDVDPIFGALTSEPAVKDWRTARFEGDFEKATAVAQKIQNPTAHALATLTARRIHRTQADLEANREEIAVALDRFCEQEFDPSELWNLLRLPLTFEWAYLGGNCKPWLEKLMNKVYHEGLLKVAPGLCQPLPEKRRPGKPRVGVLSSRLTAFNGSRWALGWIKHLKPDCEIYAFHAGEDWDHYTPKWVRMADAFFHLSVPAHKLGRFIRNFDLDAILITDIGMDGLLASVALQRLARVQMTGWGHPVTSGSPNMDWYLSSEWMEPDNGQDHYTEKLIRLPHSGLTYPYVGDVAVDVMTADLDLPERFLFNAQNPIKLQPKYDEIYAEIAERAGMPMMFACPISPKDREAFEARLAPYPNLKVLRKLTSSEFLAVTKLATTFVDAPEWNGGNTTVEALVHGTPVVTLPGDTMRARHSFGFMKQANVSGLVAKDLREFVEFSCDRERQREVMEKLDGAALINDPAPALAIKELLLNEINA